MAKTTDDPKYKKRYEQLGVVFDSVSSNEGKAECPWCGGSKFSVNIETGQYQCFSKNSCGLTGNAITFMRDYYATMLHGTKDSALQPLKNTRNLSLGILKKWGVVWDELNDRYLIPAIDESGEVQNLLMYYRNGKKFSLAGMATELFGINLLEKDSDRTLLLCEGPL
jgi:hypothetical protein